MPKYTRPDEDLVELLWQDGNVILQKQTHHRSTPIPEPDRDHSFRRERTYGKPRDPIPDDVTTPWLQHSIDDTLGRDICTEFFFGATSKDPIDAIEGEGCRKFAPAKETSTFNYLLAEDNIFPTRLQVFSTDPQINLPNTNTIMNFHCQSIPTKIDTRQDNEQFSAKAMMNPNHKDIRQSSSTMIKMSSKCSRNHIDIKCKPCQPPQNNASSSREVTNAQTSTPSQGHAAAPTITSSSGGSGSGIGRTILQNSSNSRQKRKQVEIDDTDFQSEDGEDYSIEPSKQQQISGSTQRSRSTEVHNHSERKRRDRINEKLKALQDLIPHCSKTDKASVLDEAIEYLKSLQMQFQIMWMGRGMAQMMLPNLQHYYSSLSMGMPHAPMTPMPGSIQIPGVTMFNQHVPPMAATNRGFPIMAPVNNAPQMPNVGNADMYARYIGLLQMQQTQ